MTHSTVRSISALCSLLVCLLVSPAAIFADDDKPPSSGRTSGKRTDFPPANSATGDDRPPPSGRSSGGRGCGTRAATAPNVPGLILLSPPQQRGQTASTRPTFAWFVRDPEMRSMQFQLYEEKGNQFQLVKEIKGERFKTQPGILVMSIPPSEPALEVGKRYRWQVEIVCNPNRPSGNLFAAAEVDVVPMPADLKQRLAQSGDRVTQATLLHQQKLWYDALDRVLLPAESAPSLESLRLSLLDQVAVNDTERQLLHTSKTYSVSP